MYDLQIYYSTEALNCLLYEYMVTISTRKETKQILIYTNFEHFNNLARIVLTK